LKKRQHQKISMLHLQTSSDRVQKKKIVGGNLTGRWEETFIRIFPSVRDLHKKGKGQRKEKVRNKRGKLLKGKKCARSKGDRGRKKRLP